MEFIAISIDIIEIRLMPKAVLSALENFICFIKIKVSKIILVINPFMIAKIIMPKVGNVIWVS